jgi:hypothetical protein
MPNDPYPTPEHDVAADDGGARGRVAVRNDLVARIDERTIEPPDGSEFEDDDDITLSVIVDVAVLPSAPVGYNLLLSLTSKEDARLAASGALAFSLAPGDSSKHYLEIEHIDASGGNSVYNVRAVLSANPIGSGDEIELVVLPGVNGSWQYTVV